MDLPEHINVIRTFTYDVPSIVNDLKEMNDDSDYEPDIDEIMEYIHDWAYEDHSTYPSRHDLVWQDENGTEL